MRYITEQEYKIASRYLFLSMAIRVIENDMEILRDRSIFKIQEPYIYLQERILRKAIEERKELKRVMSQKKIEVALTNKRELFTEYTIYCKGREEVKNYFNPNIKKKVSSILNDFF